MLHPMSDPIETVVAFVEGRLTTADFRHALYTHVELEALLVEPGVRPPDYVGAGTFYLYLLDLDLDDPAGAVDAEGLCRHLLQALNVPHVVSPARSSLHDALLRAQPRWLSVDTSYLSTHLLPRAEGRTGRDLVAWLRQELLDRFRFVGRPPKWIQAPAWPIGASGPMVFLGQLAIRDYFHDEAAVYVFHDPATGLRETVLQLA